MYSCFLTVVAASPHISIVQHLVTVKVRPAAVKLNAQEKQQAIMSHPLLGDKRFFRGRIFPLCVMWQAAQVNLWNQGIKEPLRDALTNIVRHLRGAEAVKWVDDLVFERVCSIFVSFIFLSPCHVGNAAPV
jgi:hypothetical protein